ncbi:MAG: fimbrillin family protein [Bacteroidales bacterium]|nr:fimbrillin family protein [Bacteroidales bacterium]
MNRYTSLISLFCIPLFLISCSKSNPVCNQEDPIEADVVKSVSFIVPNFKIIDGIETKTQIGPNSSFQWSENDTVGIYPNSGSQVYFAMTEGAGASSAEFDGGGWDFKPSAVYYSYYPFIGDIYLKRDHIPVSYLGQKQIGTSSTSHIGPFDFMYTGATSSASGKLNFSYHHLSTLLTIKATLPAGTYTKLAVTAPSEVFTTTGYFSLLSSSPAVVSTGHSNQIVVDLEGITLTEQSMFMVYLLLAPVDVHGVELTISVLNSQKKEYQQKKTTSYVYEAGNQYTFNCAAFTEVPQSMGLIVGDWDDGGTIGGDAE